jgi:hypothetical protein
MSDISRLGAPLTAMLLIYLPLYLLLSVVASSQGNLTNR